MNPEDVPPKETPEVPEPSAEDFHRAASELEPEPEHIAVTAIKSGIAGFALAAGLLAAAPGYTSIAASPPTAISATMKDLPSAALQAGPMSGEGEPPDPSLSLLLQPRVRWTPQGTVSYDFGPAASNLYPHFFNPTFRPTLSPAQAPRQLLSIPDRFQDRMVAPDMLAAAADRLPDWSTPFVPFGNTVQDHSSQLMEEPLEVLLVQQNELQNPSGIPKATAASRAEAKSYIGVVWTDLRDKLGDPKTVADKIADDLFKLPEYLLTLLGLDILRRLGLKKHGKRDDDQKPPAATDPEMVAGFAAVKVFAAGLEHRNGVLLQTGRALRRINKLLVTERRSLFAPPALYIQSAWSSPKGTVPRGMSTQDLAGYLNLLAGAYSTDDVEATVAVGFYTRVDGRWRFADVNCPDRDPLPPAA